jgi:hypothetical protein
LTKLEWLYAGGTKLTDDGLRHLADLTELRFLDLNWTAGITGSGFKHLGGLKNFSELHAHTTQVDDAAMEHLVGLPLVKLSLIRTKITDAGLPHLKQMKALRELWLQETMVSSAGLTELRAALPQCKIHAD